VADQPIQDLQTADPFSATLVGSAVLDGVRIGLRLWMNARDFRWSIDVLDSAGRFLIQGQALVAQADVFRPHRARLPGLPPGLLFVIDTTGQGSEPSGFNAWRSTHAMAYRPLADL